MRIALLTSVPDWRGSSESLAKIAAGLAGRGHPVQFLTAAPAFAARSPPVDLALTRLDGPGSGARDARTLRGVVLRHRVELLLADTPRDLRLSALVSLTRSSRVVYRCNLHRPDLDLWDRLSLRRVAACIYQSRWLQEEAERNAPGLRRVLHSRIPNGYDVSRYAPNPEAGRGFRADWGIAPDAHVVMTHARLVPGKGHQVALAALARLRASGIPVVYLVCGQGPSEAELRALAASLGLPAVFTGQLESEELVAALAAANVVVHPSLREIFPNAVGEAMACGRPVVATDAGGTSELLGRDGRAGLLVPPEDPAALGASVALLLSDPGLRARLGASARRRIETDFPLERMIDEYERVLEQVLR